MSASPKAFAPRVRVAVASTAALLLAACAGGAPAAPTSAPAATTAPKPAVTTAPAAAPAAASPAAAAVTSAPAAAGKKFTIGMSDVGLTGSFLVGESYGAFDEAKKQGVEFVYLEAGGFTGVQKQIANTENLIQRKVDAIIIDPISLEALGPALDEAKAAGIPVIGTGDILDHPAVVASVSSQQEDIGKAMGQALVDVSKGQPTNLVILAGPPGAEWTTKREAGFESVIKGAPNIKILTTQWFPDESRANGLKLAEDYLKTFPNANAFYTADNAVGLGVGDTLKAQGKVGQVQLITCVVDADTVQMVKDGAITADVAQQPVTMGRTAVQLALKVLNGQQVDKTNLVPTVTITKDNVNQVQTDTMMAPEGWKP